MPLQAGQTLQSKYRIERLIGEGGFGYVYQATDLLLNRRVAIKELKPEVSHDSEAFQRFVREAQVASAIQHPNIVAVYGMELIASNYYIVMEYMDGGSLADLLRARGYLAPNDAANIALAILDALAAVHARGIIHRDIKPSNVLFSASGRVKLGDFGIARQSAPGLQSLTQTGMVLGTIEYMAPELARGERADARSDVYAVGALLYETLAGRRRLDFGNNALLNLEIVKTRAPLPLLPSVPRPLASVVMKALEKSRAARFQSASEMSGALRSMKGSAPTRPVPVGRDSKTPLWVALGVAVVGILIFVLAFASIVVRIQSVSVAQMQQTQAAMTAIAVSRAATVAAPTVTLINPPMPTVAGAVTKTKETPTNMPTVTVSPIIGTATISTTVPVSTVMPITPTFIATPPPGDFVYEIPYPSTIFSLLNDFFGVSKPTAQDVSTFYNAHAEIWCSPPGGNPSCLKGGSILRLKQGNRFGEIDRIGLGDPRLTPNNYVWLILQVDEGTTGVLNGLAPAVLDKLKGQWMFVHGYMTIQQGFKIEPPDFIFVWNENAGVFEQVK